MQVKCRGPDTSAEIAQAQQKFSAETGWQLELEIQPAQGSNTATPRSTPTLVQMDQHSAIQTAQRLLRGQPGYVKVGAEPGRGILHTRFHFPEIARQRYAGLFAEIEAQTG